MGYGFMIWAVDTNKLRQVAGSKDEKLRRMIGGRFKRDIARLDDMFDSPNTYEALQQIVDGTIPEGARGSVYSYAFKLLVEHFGKFQDNSCVYPWNSPDFKAIDAALTEMGVPFKFDTLQWGGLPVKLPSPDDFPCTGWVSPEDVKKVDAAFAKATYSGTDNEVRDLVAAMQGWFRNAAAKDWGLVSYYH
ncbi:MAG TPA: hypothetical protein PK156_26210 [Polyangium sp.]|nr:hypothetical protein [Polyangium sp.]